MEPTSPDPLDAIDDKLAELGSIQLKIIALLAKAGQEHQAIDAEYAPRLNFLYRNAQELFDETHELANANQSRMLKGKTKSARRNNGSLGWRVTPRLVLSVSEDELIAKIRSLSQTLNRRFVRRTIKHELNREALLSTANQASVEQIEGVKVDRSEDFHVTPSGGVRMSSAKPYWPFLEGLSGPQALRTVLDDSNS